MTVRTLHRPRPTEPRVNETSRAVTYRCVCSCGWISHFYSTVVFAKAALADHLEEAQ